MVIFPVSPQVVIVPDEVPAISLAVHTMSEAFEVVVTSGGVGPTPDDVTMAGVAHALGVPLTRNAALERRLRAYFGDNVTEAHFKMAEAPEGVRL
jgi:molybdopterin-biosynthesis enzyme MoeA-like protein